MSDFKNSSKDNTIIVKTDHFKPPKFSWITGYKNKTKMPFLLVEYTFSDLRITLTIKHFY